MPISILNKSKRLCPKTITNYNPKPSTVKVATGASITTRGTFQASFRIANENFTETFILMETMNQTILGIPFFEKHDILIHPKTQALNLQNMTIQLTERVHTDGKISSLTTMNNFFLHAVQNLSVKPNASEITTCLLSSESFSEGTIAIVEPNPRFEKQTGLCVTSAIVKFNAQKQVSLGILNLLPHQVTGQKNAQVAEVTILTASQAQYLQPVNPDFLTDHLKKSVNGLIADSEHKVYPSNDEFWFPTPENCSNPENLTGIEKRIYDEIVALKITQKIESRKESCQPRKIPCTIFMGKLCFQPGTETKNRTFASEIPLHFCQTPSRYMC